MERAADFLESHAPESASGLFVVNTLGFAATVFGVSYSLALPRGWQMLDAWVLTQLLIGCVFATLGLAAAYVCSENLWNKVISSHYYWRGPGVVYCLVTMPLMMFIGVLAALGGVWIAVTLVVLKISSLFA